LISWTKISDRQPDSTISVGDSFFKLQISNKSLAKGGTKIQNLKLIKKK
jgi:hypothetical protein